jgi:hypothetical protein
VGTRTRLGGRDGVLDGDKRVDRLLMGSGEGRGRYKSSPHSFSFPKAGHGLSREV